jgi:hypothetical protein
MRSKTPSIVSKISMSPTIIATSTNDNNNKNKCSNNPHSTILPSYSTARANTTARCRSTRNAWRRGSAFSATTAPTQKTPKNGATNALKNYTRIVTLVIVFPIYIVHMCVRVCVDFCIPQIKGARYFCILSETHDKSLIRSAFLTICRAVSVYAVDRVGFELACLPRAANCTWTQRQESGTRICIPGDDFVLFKLIPAVVSWL